MIPRAGGAAALAEWRKCIALCDRILRGLGDAGKKDCRLRTAERRVQTEECTWLERARKWPTGGQWPSGRPFGPGLVWLSLAWTLPLALAQQKRQQRAAQKVAASSQEFRTRMLSAATKKTFKCLALAAKSQHSCPLCRSTRPVSLSHSWLARLWGRRRRLRNSFLLLLLQKQWQKVVRSLSPSLTRPLSLSLRGDGKNCLWFFLQLAFCYRVSWATLIWFRAFCLSGFSFLLTLSMNEHIASCMLHVTRCSLRGERLMRHSVFIAQSLW